MASLLSTAEAADIAGVGPTSVKRWADLGLFPHQKTAGGHRRFPRDAFERFLLDRTGEQEEPGAWVALALGARPYELEGALLSARARLGAWHAVAAELGGAIDEVGTLWANGRISVVQEHAASERLSRALSRIGETLPGPPDGPRCLLATAQGDEHTLGLSLVELCLREVGWAVQWAGGRTPSAEVAAAVELGGLAAVALSASAASSDHRALARQVATVARACRRAGVALLLGGRGAWPEGPAPVVRLGDFASLNRWLVGAGRAR